MAGELVMPEKQEAAEAQQSQDLAAALGEQEATFAQEWKVSAALGLGDATALV